MNYSDQKLRAFLEGDLPENEARKIEAEILADPSFERRIMALDEMPQILGPAMRSLPTEDRVARLNQVLGLSETHQTMPRLWFGASIAAALAIGFFASSILAPNAADQTNDWRVEIARYQALYVPQTVANLDGSDAALEGQFDLASEAVGLTLNPQELDQLEGLTLARAQILGYKDQSLIQIVYKDSAGAPIAFCLLRKDPDARASDRIDMELAGLASSSWENATHQFILIGTKDQARISELADQLQSLNL